MKKQNVVELIMDAEHQQAPCKFGNIVMDHHCYCHHPSQAPRKCPVWRDQIEWTKESGEEKLKTISIPMSNGATLYFTSTTNRLVGRNQLQWNKRSCEWFETTEG